MTEYLNNPNAVYELWEDRTGKIRHENFERIFYLKNRILNKEVSGRDPDELVRNAIRKGIDTLPITLENLTTIQNNVNSSRFPLSIEAFNSIAILYNSHLRFNTQSQAEKSA